jgi:hypothetical protein
MVKNLSASLQLVLFLLVMQMVACKSAPSKKDQPPPPAPPGCLLLTGEHIYGKPKEIRTATISDSKTTRDTATFDWASRKVTYLGDITYMGVDLRPDSSVAIDHRSFQHYFKTPYFKEYYSFSHTTEPAEYHFLYELDTVKRQVREIKANPADTLAYSIDYFSGEGFLIHRFVKLSKKDNYHVYYTNDNHGNPIAERMITRDLDFIQEKCEYEYDKEGNWVIKDLYRFYPDGQSFKMQFKRKITY